MLRLRELRLENKYTQEKIAQKLNVSRQVYSNYENEINEPSLEMLDKIASLYQCSIDYLLGRTDDFGVIHISAQKNTADKLSADEKKLLETYRALNTKNKMHVSVYADVRLEEQEERLKNGGIFDM